MNDINREPKRTQVLLIEDDESQAALIRKKLKPLFFDVVVCHDVEVGLKLSREQNFAVAIVDLDLGGQSGLDFVRGLNQTRCKTNVILHSVDSTFESAKEGLNLGVFAYVEKGRNDNQLVEQCHRAAAAYLSDNLDVANEEIAFQLRLLDSVDHGIIATSTDGKIVYWNRFSENLTGLSQKESLGKSVFDVFLLGPNDRQLVQRQIETGGIWQGECKLQLNSGESAPIFVRVAISVLRDSRGILIGSVIAHHDLSSVKQNEQRLERRAKLLAINADLGRLAVEITDRNTFLRQVIEKIDEGLSLECGRVLLTHPTGETIETLATVGNNSKGALGAFPLTSEDQLLFDESTNSFRIPFSENGKLIGFIEGEFKSARKFGQEKKDFLQSVSSLVSGVLLRNWATHLWQSLFEHSLDALFIANDQGQFSNFNQEACELLGYSRGELSKLSLVDLAVVDRSQNSLALIHQLIAKRKLRGELELIRKDKTVLLVEFLAVANILPGVHIAHVRDITGRKLSEKLISEQQDQLTHAQRTSTLGQIAATLAHEINQPLGAISIFSGGLLYGLKKSDSSDSELSDTLELIHGEALKAGVIVNRLRKYMTPNALHLKRIDVNTSIHDTLKILKHLLSDSNSFVRLELESSLPMVEVDPIRMQQVLVNVIKNSLEAIQSIERTERIVRLTTRSVDNLVQICISDNGPALADFEIADFFKPYHTTKPGGLGMGLCISRSIIEQHRGTMNMTQMIPNGMLTTIQIPVAS
jgi:PAS domain S-box-containing protein